MGNFFNSGSVLGIVFLAVGLVLMLVIAPLVSNAGEQIYATLRPHCERNGERFTQVVIIPGDVVGSLASASTFGGTPLAPAITQPTALNLELGGTTGCNSLLRLATLSQAV